MSMSKLTIRHDNVRHNGQFVDYPPEDFAQLRRTSAPVDIPYSLSVINKPTSRAGHYYNCGACAVAFDLRLKGYDVVARLKPDGTNVGDLAEYYENGHYYQPFPTEYPDYLLRSWDKYVGHCKQLQAMKRRGVKQINRTRVYRKVGLSYDSYCACVSYERGEVIERLNKLITSQYGSYGIIILGFICSDDPNERTTIFHAINYCDGTLYDAQEGCVCDLIKNNFDPREVMIIPTEGLQPKENVVELVANRR